MRNMGHFVVFQLTFQKCSSPAVPFRIAYRKIPKISPGAYIFQRPFLRGLFLEGIIDGGKFAFQNRLGQSHSWK